MLVKHYTNVNKNENYEKKTENVLSEVSQLQIE